MPELVDVPESWPVVETEDLHRDDWVMALRADRVARPGAEADQSFRRLVLEHPGAVIVLAVDEQERVLCLSQYRHPAQRRFVELPAGLCDVEGEDPVVTGQRELAEEAGLAAAEWTHLSSTYSSPGISEEVVHAYLARGLSEVAPSEDFVREHEEADMTAFWAPFDDLREAVVAGRVTDAPLVVAILVAQARGLVGVRGEKRP